MVSVKKLSNGVRVAMEEIPYVRSISFGIWVGNGSRNENQKTNGISHFIEHMLFKGTYNRSAKDIAEEMDAVGGQINAYTTKEYTCYHTRILDKHFDRAVDVMSDMFLNSKFDEDDIKKERNVIIEEISMYDDAPEELVHDKLQENIWKGCTLGLPILGTEKSLMEFDKNTFIDYFGKNYHPENTVISVAGNFNENEMLEKINKYFGSWKADRPYEHNDSNTIYTPIEYKKKKDIEQVHLCLALPSYKRDSEEKYALTVFNTIFGGGMSSRLFQKIREDNGLTYSIYSYVSSYSDAGVFAIYAGMSHNQTENVVKLICDEIKLLNTDKISEKIIAKTKEQIISNFIIGNESTASRMTSMGSSILLRNSIQTSEEVIDKIEKITGDDIYRVVDKIFDLTKISISSAGNVNGLDIKKMVEDAM